MFVVLYCKGPMGRQPDGYMGSRSHLLLVGFKLCAANKLTYLLTYLHQAQYLLVQTVVVMKMVIKVTRNNQIS